MANKFLFIGLLLMLWSCSESSKDKTDNPESKQEENNGSLLLPEHRDTGNAHLLEVLPDSVFYGMKFNNPIDHEGKTYNRITFSHLAKVKRIVVDFEVYALMEVLEFSDEVKSLDGQDIIIKGFLLPAIHTENMYVLSKHPYSNCFFCNKAGVESIMELQLNNPPKLKTKVDQIVMVKGTLQLSEADPEHLPYTLVNADIIVNF